MSLVDVLVGTAITLIIFLALFGLLRASFLVSSLAKSKAVATSIATSQMEYVRSLPYDSIGTVGGIPAGVIPQTATTTMNNLSYGVRTFIQYVDDPADGLGALDQTGITTDYKQVKITVTYYTDGTAREVELISSQSPAGLETTTGGGTLQISVVDALGAGIAGATVDIDNPSTVPTVNLTAFSNAAGLVYLPGAATSTDYRIVVTKAGYSTAQTYARDATNQNPTPGYLTVAQNQTTASTFAIDVLAALTIRTFSPIVTASFADTFADSSLLASLSSAAVSGGSVILATDAGGYLASGSAQSQSVAPTYLAGWLSVEAVRSVSVNTNMRVRVVDSAGTPLPDAVLAGNVAGFTAFPIDLSGISTTTYPTLALAADLSTSLATETPSLDSWNLNYRRGPIPLPNIAFDLQGAKTVGTTGAGASIYKTEISDTTGASASKSLSLEWDAYQLGLTGYDVVDACGTPPYSLAPSSVVESSLVLGTNTAHSILVGVRDAGGAVVPGASVTLARTGYTSTITGSSCGAASFGSLSSASDYTITITKTGYTTTVFTNVSISGDTFYEATFD